MIGIMNGMVMQRNSNDLSEITIYSEYEIKETPYYTSTNGKNYPLSLKETENQDFTYILSGIPVGGPYELYIGNEHFTDIYVGDLWLLAGQSNMEGVGACTKDDLNFTGNPSVRVLQMANYWETGTPITHKTYDTFDKVHTEILGATRANSEHYINNRCVGPGYFFGEEMYNYEKVPQGLIPCAHGGTTMDQWSPEGRDLGGDKSLYGAMYRRFKANGSKVRGMFWYQGCSETNPKDKLVFEEKMLNFVKAVRADFGENLPIVQVQIGHVYTTVPVPIGDNNIDWNDVREIQRNLSCKTENFTTAYVTSYTVDDTIHLSRNSQSLLGKNAAELMNALIHGKTPREIKVDIDNIHVEVDDFRGDFSKIIVPFINVEGLKAEPQPYGFCIYDDKEVKDYTKSIYTSRIDGNKVIIKTCLPPDRFKQQEFSLYYCYGLNTIANLTDNKGYSIPAFGPVKLTKLTF